MITMHEYDYSVRPRAGAQEPDSGDLERVAGEVKIFLSLYDREAQAEVLPGDAAAIMLHVVTKVGNGDIVDSAVRISGLRSDLVAARAEAEPAALPPPALDAGPAGRALQRMLGWARWLVGG
ncbi:MAG TPA: hypothetical protein VF801_09050 [Rhodocyclaceae bacterium]